MILAVCFQLKQLKKQPNKKKIGLNGLERASHICFFYRNIFYCQLTLSMNKSLDSRFLYTKAGDSEDVGSEDENTEGEDGARNEGE